MFNYITNVIGGDPAVFFSVVPGIYKPRDGYAPCNQELMNGGNCSSTRNGWVAIDYGTWWLRDSAFFSQISGSNEPSGNYTKNCYLGPSNNRAYLISRLIPCLIPL